MDLHFIWGYVILLLPLIIAIALIPACRLREHLLRRAGPAQWLEPRWLAQPKRHVLECSHPVQLEALTGSSSRRHPYISNLQSQG